MKAARKRSKQREAILDYLKSTKEHPNADMVYENVRKEIPNISLGTVYRNLNLLSESGEIQKFSIDGKSDRFDFETKSHYHVFCHQCDRVMDLEMEPLKEIEGLAEKAFEGEIEGHSICFFGRCKNCLKKMNKKIDK